ncbi:uncharacterized protein BT62DRAFT_1070984 [Guyanagaster necrorhizus]|uniref:Uncharacterized protein n=1 Tax=Guyanagaster necrorhizus TaxID=856835 RepID=A0A9P8AXG5_9AGAR|nr:uncharacterized protein BT62DRAFT_1070984 [Guyanagaster necrorhizus MCA 3950]KAG7451759.1 hypothetical protein BT62DRAFT_1070984 [Guyanagaster necrorhizus MCA 3950]
MAYGVTKAALDKPTLVLGTSFAVRGIPVRVNVLQLGSFASQLIGPEILEIIKTKPAPGAVAPMHGSDAEIGTTAVYLAVSDYTNGAVMCVDGGTSPVNPRMFCYLT